MNPQADRAQYGAYLKEKRRRLIALAEAEQARTQAKLEYNLIDVEEEIRQFETAPPSPEYDRPSVEELTRATRHIQALEAQMESLDQMTNQPGIGEAMRPLIEGMIRPMIAGQLEQAEEYRTRIQTALEQGPGEETGS